MASRFPPEKLRCPRSSRTDARSSAVKFSRPADFRDAIASRSSVPRATRTPTDRGTRRGKWTIVVETGEWGKAYHHITLSNFQESTPTAASEFA